MKPEHVDMPIMLGPAQASTLYEPLGTVCVIGSWNFPLFTTVMPIVQVIAAGNCAVVKPSEISPWCSLWISQFMLKYLDPDCYRCVQGQIKVAIKCTSSKFD